MPDMCIYIFEANVVFAMISLYIDDIFVACNNTAWRVAFTALVRSRFNIMDQGDLYETSLGCTSPWTEQRAPSASTKASTCASCLRSMTW
jgi:hypothetical protein